MIRERGLTMFPTRGFSVVISAIALIGMQARAAEKEKEPLAIIELGGAGEWGVSGGSGFGPSAAVEFEPIKDWLEIEIGTAPLFAMVIPNGTPISYSKSHSPCPKR